MPHRFPNLHSFLSSYLSLFHRVFVLVIALFAFSISARFSFLFFSTIFPYLVIYYLFLFIIYFYILQSLFFYVSPFVASFLPTCPSVYSQTLSLALSLRKMSRQTSVVFSWNGARTLHLNLKFGVSAANCCKYTAIHNALDTAVMCLGLMSLRV